MLWLEIFLVRFGANLKTVNCGREKTRAIASYHPVGTRKNHKNQGGIWRNYCCSE
jgi:hypothetical protein